MICFQISIFEPLKTAHHLRIEYSNWLWFAFKLVSLNHWKQHDESYIDVKYVVICFQISIFEPLKTANMDYQAKLNELWFAFKLVSLNHWKQLSKHQEISRWVVICFQISIFEPLKTAAMEEGKDLLKLWFAFKLVSLNHWKQLNIYYKLITN